MLIQNENDFLFLMNHSLLPFQIVLDQVKSYIEPKPNHLISVWLCLIGEILTWREVSCGALSKQRMSWDIFVVNKYIVGKHQGQQ